MTDNQTTEDQSVDTTWKKAIEGILEFKKGESWYEYPERDLVQIIEKLDTLISSAVRAERKRMEKRLALAQTYLIHDDPREAQNIVDRTLEDLRRQIYDTGEPF